MESATLVLRDQPEPPRIAVIGAGTIGKAFALVFANAGMTVRVHDADRHALEGLLPGVRQSLDDLARFGLLEGNATQACDRILPCPKLSDALAGAQYVQECVPESLELKRDLFLELDRHTNADAVLASSSSAFPVSRFVSELPNRHRCLVLHPGNPPFLLRVAELVPAEFTSREAVKKARDVAHLSNLKVIEVRREVEGFVFNRLQGALLREAYCLVRDGVASVEDIDMIVRDGLGLRWSVVGPFETVDLNTRGGIGCHAKRLGPAYARMGAERGQHDPWTPELVAEVTRQRRTILPLALWDERIRWRDQQLMTILAMRKVS